MLAIHERIHPHHPCSGYASQEFCPSGLFRQVVAVDPIANLAQMISNKVDAVHQQGYRDGDLQIWISPLAAPMHRVFPVDALCFMASSSG